MKPFLSVIIPAYNISKNFKEDALPQVASFLEDQKYTWEVILVDDGSQDNTFDILSNFTKRHKDFFIKKIKHGGKAAAVMAGVMQASGEIILFTDFDQSTPIKEINKFIAEFKSGFDIVIAHRIREKKNDTIISLLRHRGFNLLVQLMALPGIPDTQCGFKAFRNTVAKDLFNSLSICKPSSDVKGPYMGAFDVELLFLARRKGYKIKSVKVNWIRENSKNLTLFEPIKMLWEITRIRLYYSLNLK